MIRVHKWNKIANIENMSCVARIPAFFMFEKKDADQISNIVFVT